VQCSFFVLDEATVAIPRMLVPQHDVGVHTMIAMVIIGAIASSMQTGARKQEEISKRNVHQNAAMLLVAIRNSVSRTYLELPILLPSRA
jgi:hypothetical protein